MLSSGIPQREEYLRLEAQPLYKELLEFSRQFDQRFIAENTPASRYSSKWVKDPFLQWSRRWEYVYVAQQLAVWLAGERGTKTVVDAGSGFTFYPFFLLQTHANLHIKCFDHDPLAGKALMDAKRILDRGPGFHIEDLESLTQESETVDGVYSVSVIEHTSNPHAVINEVNRILKPGGLFICTFDVSFESRSPMYTRRVEQLVKHIEKVFKLPDDWPPIAFDALSKDESIVTTLWDAHTIKSGLPWQRPRLIWLYDMFRFRFRASVPRPMTFCCLTMIKKPA